MPTTTVLPLFRTGLALVDLKSLQIVLISYQFERNPHDILEFFVMSTNDTNIYDRVDISFFFYFEAYKDHSKLQDK